MTDIIIVVQYYVSYEYILVIEPNKIFRFSYFTLHITFSDKEIITTGVVFENGRNLSISTRVKSKQISACPNRHKF